MANVFQKTQYSADIVKFFVYIPSSIGCLLACSGWNWFSCVDLVGFYYKNISQCTVLRM